MAAYSRWNNSIWYTFWSAAGQNLQFKWPTGANRDAQIFEICDIPSFYITYGEIKSKERYDLLTEVREFYSKSYPHRGLKANLISGKLEYEDTLTEPKNIYPTDLEELSGYLDIFIRDVDDHFKWKNFFRYEWWYPIRNAVRWKMRRVWNR